MKQVTLPCFANGGTVFPFQVCQFSMLVKNGNIILGSAENRIILHTPTVILVCAMTRTVRKQVARAVQILTFLYEIAVEKPEHWLIYNL